jgi:hypothetical protein
MKLTIWSLGLWFATLALAEGQQVGGAALESVNQPSSTSAGFTVQGTTPDRERLLRTQIQIMQPDVLPNRIIFVPHWQYIYATKVYHLHVPTGYGSKMFTHLASRSVFIDTDSYGGDDWLSHWMAHELGHLEKNNADEHEAEKPAAKYRRRLEIRGNDR